MPRETAPRPNRAKMAHAAAKIPWGDRRWRRFLTGEELEEVRKREATVDAEGVRRVKIPRTMNFEEDDAYLAGLEEKGYEIETKERFYIATIAQTEFEKIEKARQNLSHVRKQRSAAPSAKSPFRVNAGELAPVDSRDARDPDSLPDNLGEGGVDLDALDLGDE